MRVAPRQSAATIAPIFAVAFARDGLSLATGDAQGAVTLWDVPAARQAAPFRNHTQAVWAVQFDPEGQVLVSAGQDGTFRLWDLMRRRPRAIVPQGHEPIWSVATARRGRLLAAGD